MALYQTFHPVVFLFSLLWGIFIYIAYEVLRFIRVITRNNKTVVFVTDLLFMIFSAIVAFMFSLAYNFGQLRIYMIVGFFLSFIVLRLTLGRLSIVLFTKFYSIFCTFSRKIIKFFKKVLAKLLKFFTPLVYNLCKEKRVLFFINKGSKNDRRK